MFDVKKETAWFDRTDNYSYTVYETYQEDHWADVFPNREHEMLQISFNSFDNTMLCKRPIDDVVSALELKYAMLFAETNEINIEKALRILSLDKALKLVQETKSYIEREMYTINPNMQQK